MTAGIKSPKRQNAATNFLLSENNSFSWILPRMLDFLKNSLIQVRTYHKIYPGIMHGLIFWGVTIQVIGTAINLMQMALFVPFVELPFPRGSFYLVYELIMDLAGLAILLGVALAAFRRFILKPNSLPTHFEDLFVLALLAMIPIAGYFLEAMRLISLNPPWAVWSPVGSTVAGFLRSIGINPNVAFQLHGYAFWIHAALGLGLLVSIPFTKLRHLVASPVNIISRPTRKENTLQKIDNIEEVEFLGVGNIKQFNSHQLVSFDACTQCGRCAEVCPATISGSAYSPRELIQNLRNTMVSTLEKNNGKSKPELLGDVVSDEYPWSCTTCGACLFECPVFINSVDQIIDLRRYQSLTTGRLPKSVSDTLRNIERQGNPWGIPPEQRLEWSEDLSIRILSPGDETDILLFLGCAFAFDDRNKKIARSFARLLQKAGIDFAILGLDETCCGETARRMGHEYIFQVFAGQNIEVFSSVKFNRIVTQCPHCFNTLKNEYPQFGGDYIVLHYTEFLNELVREMELFSTNGNTDNRKYTFHDSCYLGRLNQIYKQPRSILKRSHIDLVEMSRSGRDSFCCGGGGGQMWMETDIETRINHFRLEDALGIKAEVIATACPYCLLMFDDAIRSKGFVDQIKVQDIVEILEKRLDV